MGQMRLVVVGAGGRMGRALTKAVTEVDGAIVVAAIEREGSEFLGQDAGELAGVGPLGVAVSDDPLTAFANSDGVLDFTAPAASLWFAELAAQARIVHVIGTTGWAEGEDEPLKAAARHARIVKSGNMSLGVNLLASLVRVAAAALDTDFDIEVVEMHHKHKVDAPSGTALLLGQAAAEGRGIDLNSHAVRSRDGIMDPRRTGDIGFATLRGGSVIGEHSVVFAGEGERIELTHRSEDRQLFARGAVKAALWGYDQKPGFYSMADVLGLNA
ncbi:MAG: 4-hydroxy-tetrahydrodipicolinate reductase [Roseibium sp.]|uniref:4-hydroxy-tetrahydrodipicolinate reductase n=1 Tax=Roseibium sp. TaxID=1936156 RepID=UPI003D9C5EF3